MSASKLPWDARLKRLYVEFDTAGDASKAFAVLERARQDAEKKGLRKSVCQFVMAGAQYIALEYPDATSVHTYKKFLQDRLGNVPPLRESIGHQRFEDSRASELDSQVRRRYREKRGPPNTSRSAVAEVVGLGPRKVEHLPIKALGLLNGEQRKDRGDMPPYPLGALLGEGAYGRIYESGAHAVKIFKKTEQEKQTSHRLLPTAVAEALQETQIMAFLGESRHLVALLDVFILADSACVENGRLALVYQTAKCDLNKRLRENGPLDPESLRLATRDIFEAIAFIHSKGVVHCDVSMRNVLCIADSAPVLRCVLADFGMAACPRIARGFPSVARGRGRETQTRLLVC